MHVKINLDEKRNKNTAIYVFSGSKLDSTILENTT